MVLCHTHSPRNLTISPLSGFFKTDFATLSFPEDGTTGHHSEIARFPRIGLCHTHSVISHKVIMTYDLALYFYDYYHLFF